MKKRLRKLYQDTQSQVSYQLRATLVCNQVAIEEAIATQGRFIFATNIVHLHSQNFSLAVCR